MSASDAKTCFSTTDAHTAPDIERTVQFIMAVRRVLQGAHATPT